jgi:hypothetical protein
MNPFILGYRHYTELEPLPPGHPGQADWDVYRREVGRLLAEGHAGEYVLICGGEIIGTWPTHLDATEAWTRHFFLRPAVLRQILEHDPIKVGYWKVCRD